MGLAGYFKKLIIEDSDTPIHCFRALISCFNGDVTESVYLGRNIEGVEHGNIVYWHSDGGSYKEITFGEKVTYLIDACVYCNNLTSVVLPKNIKSISGTFEGCKNLVSVSGEGVEFADAAFAGCEKLTTINLPSVRMIDGAFSNCPYTSFVVPQGVVSMTGAFKGCSYLETITIPGTVIHLGEYSSTFGGCNALKTIIVGNPTPVELPEGSFESMVYLNATLKVPVGAAEAYKAAEGWKNFANIEEDASITDDIFTIAIENKGESYEGTIELNVNEALPAFEYNDYNTYKFVKKGEAVEIKAVPKDNYILSSLEINGVDVISEVVDNVYKTIVTGGMNIKGYFKYYELPIFLTIRQADNGCLRQLINKKESFTFYIEPADGWKLHTVTLNGKDITSEVGSDGMLEIRKIKENTELLVSYEQSNNAVNELNSSRAKVYAYDGTLFISNAEIGEFVYVYNEAGVNVAMRKIGSSMESIQVEKGHVYIVKLKDKTVKLSI